MERGSGWVYVVCLVGFFSPSSGWDTPIYPLHHHHHHDHHHEGKIGVGFFVFFFVGFADEMKRELVFVYLSP